MVGNAEREAAHEDVSIIDSSYKLFLKPYDIFGILKLNSNQIMKIHCYCF